MSQHQDQIERTVLGACLRGDPEAVETARGYRLTAEAFANDAHRKIWEAIESVERTNGAVDLVAVAASLHALGMESDCLRPIYLTDLTDAAPVSLNLDPYVRELTTLAARRRSIDEFGHMQRRLLNQEPFATDDQALIAESYSRILAADTSVATARSVAAITDELIGTLEERVANRDDHGPKGVPTGIELLDHSLGGWVPGRLYFVAGRTSMGKTTLSINFASSAAHASSPWLYCTLEMTAQDIVEKLLSLRSRVKGASLQSGNLSEDELDRLHRGCGELLAMHGYVDNQSGRYIETFEVAVRRAVRRHGVKVVFLDYLQQMRARGRWTSRQAELTEITDRIKHLALSLNVAIVAAAQLNREAERQGVPLLSHLKDCGSIEQDADAVLFIHRDDKEGAPTLLIVAKNRWGRRGRIVLDVDLAVNRFSQANFDQTPLEN